jgi:cytochrome c553
MLCKAGFIFDNSNTGYFSSNSVSAFVLYELICRAIAQAVSHRLATAAARVRSQVKSCGMCGGQSGTGQVSSE